MLTILKMINKIWYTGNQQVHHKICFQSRDQVRAQVGGEVWDKVEWPISRRTLAEVQELLHKAVRESV